jgi:hypothetical protein
MTRSRPPLLLVVFAGWVAAIGLSAGVTSLWLRRWARAALKVHFLSHLRRPASEAAHIWLTNSRLTCGAAICIFLVLLARSLAPAGLRGLQRLPFLAADVVLAVTLLRTALLAGVLLGAYGSSQARAFMPYGPVELSAWAVLAVIYINARLGRGGPARSARGLLGVELLLAVAAVMEAFL